MPAKEPCELILEGVRHIGQLLDISPSGARVKVAAAGSVGMKGELRIAAFGLTVCCELTACDPNAGAVGLAFASPIKLPPSLADVSSRAA
jgi:hypothetical protein